MNATTLASVSLAAPLGADADSAVNDVEGEAQASPSAAYQTLADGRRIHRWAVEQLLLLNIPMGTMMTSPQRNAISVREGCEPTTVKWYGAETEVPRCQAETRDSRQCPKGGLFPRVGYHFCRQHKELRVPLESLREDVLEAMGFSL